MSGNEIPAGEGLIVISRRTVIQDLVRRYTVYIDKAPVGYLWAFQTGRFPVSPGFHEVRLAIPNTGTASSDAISVEVATDGYRALRTRGRGIRKLITLPVALVISIADRAANRTFETRWYKRPWIILDLDQPS